ncbi:hypothetical protein H4S08_004309 [Coemansia sp. RSA 1365]|nr:hypothetical protein H4S08_004309 [Coemansia sp. RSA 1365]
MNWEGPSKLAFSNWQSVNYTSRTSQHSRSSSTSTIVEDMISPLAAVGSQSPPATAVTADSPSLAIGQRISIKPLLTAPCSPVLQLKGGSLTPCLSPHNDSVLEYQQENSETVEASTDEELLTELQMQSSEDDSCVFDMESDWSQQSPASAALVSNALAYGSTGKPQPWAIRPMGVYDSLRAQIRAIDDDDDEFYSS